MDVLQCKIKFDLKQQIQINIILSLHYWVIFKEALSLFQQSLIKMNILEELTQRSGYHTTYAFSNLQYFFSVSEMVDYEVGKAQKLKLQQILTFLEQTKIKLNPVLALFSYLFQSTSPQNISLSSVRLDTLTLNKTNVQEVLDNQGLKLVFSLLALSIKQFQINEQVSAQDQMMLKSLFNIFYVLVYFIEKENLLLTIKQNYKQNYSKGSTFLNRFYQDVEIDTFLIKLLTLSLEVHYIPIKKVSMLYTKFLANIFSFQSTNAINKILIHPVIIFNDSAIQFLPSQNTIQENYLENLKQKTPPLNEIPRNKFCEPIERFYVMNFVNKRKNNIGDCPLAQSIVVGLLRSLLTICNSQNHKKFTTVKGTGVDSFREWQISYRYALQNWAVIQNSCSLPLQQRIKEYQQFDRLTTQKSQPNKSNFTFHQFYLHKIYTTSVITNFFTIILLGLKMNVLIQSSYFLQLISDANGILVFLKFLTDKFQFLDDINDKQIEISQNQQKSSFKISFKDKVMLTVYSILNMLHASCNNYPQKVKNYLFQYNSYLIIKKIPLLFFPSFKQDNKKPPETSQTKKKDQLQGSLPNLPSKQDLQELMTLKTQNFKQGSLTNEQSPLIIRRLTETCYDLLKIQIPYFSKKMKDTNNMKMLIDIYCRFPKEVQPIERSTLQKIQLKCRNKKHLANIQQQVSKPIMSVQELKIMHNEYNNLYYWSNDFVNQLEGGKVMEKEGENREKKTEKLQRSGGKSLREQQENEDIGEDFDYEAWLEQNLWKYYD